MVSQFLIEVLGGLVSVFIGVWLALIVDRKLRREDQVVHAAESRQEFDRTSDSILGSAIRNIAEAKRISGLLERQKALALIVPDLELAVWSANEAHFIDHCQDVGMRVIFAQFFDNLRRLQSQLDFRNNLVAGHLIARVDTGGCVPTAVFADIDRQLRDLADDVHLTGVLLVTDHGKAVHRKFFGAQKPGPAVGVPQGTIPG